MEEEVKYRTCLDCTNFATCDRIEALKDEKGLVSVKTLDIYGIECPKYFENKEKKTF